MTPVTEKPRFMTIIQARMGSTRLPGKVMKDLAGKPVLWHIANRVKQSSLSYAVVVATTTNSEDDIIESACHLWNVPVFRGSPENVLERFCGAVQFMESGKPTTDYIIRITGDCPLIDPTVIDEVARVALSGRYDYASNTNPPTFPDGLDVEVISRDVLFLANEKATLQSEREHVTPFIKNHPFFKKYNVQYSKDLSALRWTLDNQEDYELIKIIYNDLFISSKIFLMDDVLKLFLKKPELKNINSHIKRNEGYEKSLSHDRIVRGDS